MFVGGGCGVLVAGGKSVGMSVGVLVGSGVFVMVGMSVFVGSDAALLRPLKIGRASCRERV